MHFSKYGSLIISLLFGSSSMIAFAFSPIKLSLARSIIIQRSAQGSSGDNPSLSASKKERRDEEVRRKDRQQDAIPGKTSALPGAKDYPLNPAATTQEWMKHASKVEQEVYHWTETGMAALKMFQLQDASTAFAKVFSIRPNAYLWQAGIPQYYLGDYPGGAKIFHQCAALAEAKFGLPASEECIWRDACRIKGGLPGDVNGNVDHDANALPPPMEAPETRKVIRIARELFTATLEDNPVEVALCRAKLYAIVSTTNSSSNKSKLRDFKRWKLTSWFYLGLQYDAIGDTIQSKECMKMALRQSPTGDDDVICILPMLHMSVRDWFDDDDFILDNDTSTSTGNGNDEETTVTRDNVVVTSIRQSVGEMKVSQLQDALKLRGLKSHGVKEELQKKLIVALCQDLSLDV